MTPQRKILLTNMIVVAGLIRLATSLYLQLEPENAHKQEPFDLYCSQWFWGILVAQLLAWIYFQQHSKGVKEIRYQYILIKCFVVMAAGELLDEIANPLSFTIFEKLFFIICIIYATISFIRLKRENANT